MQCDKAACVTSLELPGWWQLSASLNAAGRIICLWGHQRSPRLPLW